jgi:hypothetical protein
VKSGCKSIVVSGLRFHLAVRMLVTVVTILACILLGSCVRDETIWSAMSPSPDGRWLAVAHTVQHSGPGNNGGETIVEIKETRRRFIFKTSEMVLGFSNDGSSMGLKMSWISPTHLDVTFRDDPQVLYYQVVRTSGIEITVRDLASPTSSSR